MKNKRIPFLNQPDPEKEYFTDERCYILERLHNHKSEAPFSIAQASVKTGVTTAWHALKSTDEYYYILEGKGLMEIGKEKPFQVIKGDIVTIPREIKQRITNTGNEDLVFLAICSPPFEDKNYVHLE